MKAIHSILIADPIHEDGKQLFAARGSIRFDVATGLDDDALAARIAGYDALIVRSKSQVTKKVIAAGHELKAIGRAGIGVDNIDVAAATERGIAVLNTPDANATTTAELTIAHLLSLSRHLPQADRSVRQNEWLPARFVGTELSRKTIGIIGFGTIGRQVADRCMGLKMHVIAHDPFVTNDIIQQTGAEPANLEALLQACDYVTLHCPMTEKTRNLIDAKRISLMKRGARLINCARGGLVDEEALYAALKSGQLAGAALDVYAKEPPKGSPFLTLDNVVLTPHLGASTEEAQRAVSLQIAEDMIKFLETGAAETAVNIPRISAEQFGVSRPYQDLAHALGRLIGAITEGPISEIVVRLFGRVAEFDTRPIVTEALVGFLGKRLPGRVNRVNAAHLARLQGIAVRESKSEVVRDYLSLVEIVASTDNGTTSVAGTLLGGSHPRLVRIDAYDVEAVPQGNLLFTRHDDRPGVIGALGSILAAEGINISRMQVGVADGSPTAIALIGISATLSSAALNKIRALPPIRQVVEIEL
jgi:D-3-phosphoglycerate dehydrogenase